MRWYGYGRDGDDDVDWGCLYRSVQNACAALRIRVPRMHDLVETIAGRGWGQWGEPGMFLEFFRDACGCDGELYVLHDPGCIHFSGEAPYVHLPSLPRGFWDPEWCYVVDDGTSAYAVVPWRHDLYWVDPHVVYPHTPLPEPFDYAQHMAADHDPATSGWMILKVRRRD